MARQFVKASSQYLTSATSPVSTVPLTLACWFWCNDNTAAHTLMSVNAANAAYLMEARGNLAGDPMRAAMYTAGAYVGGATSGNTYTPSAWQHSAAIYTSSTSRSILLNGGTRVTNTTSSQPAAVTAVDIGRLGGQSATQFLDGRIAHAAVWSAALADAEVQAMANGMHPLRVRPSALVAYWPLHGIDATEPGWFNGLYPLTNTGSTVAPNNPPVEPYSRRFWGTYRLIGTTGAATSYPASLMMGGFA